MSYVKKFDSDVKKFNKMYKLSESEDPKVRIGKFMSIISEEVLEGADIMVKAHKDDPEWKTDMADWLGDIIVYCASELGRYQIPIGETLNIIMDSNFSKLDANGNPIYDERGKVMKGPDYKKPEPTLAKMLETGKYNGKLV